MYRDIGEYGLIGDCRSCALVSREGSIDWLCWPRFDSDPVFLRLLDDARGGFCDLVPEVPARATRRYLPGTNILETRFETGAGTLVLTDFMPLRALPEAPETGPETEAERRVIRHLRAEGGRVRATFRVRPGFGWARRRTRISRLPGGAVLLRGGAQAVSVSASHPVETGRGGVRVTLDLAAGEEAHLVLTWAPDAMPPDATGVAARLAATREFWESWSRGTTCDGPFRDAVLRSALCLKLLTYAPSGGLIAAPTTSLPEWPGGRRNWDYRIVWIRDASFGVSAFLHTNHRREAAEFLRFLHEAYRHQRQMRVMYGVDGPLPEQATLYHLHGWRGSRPVHTGNGAVSQRQMDIFGELATALQLFVDLMGIEHLSDTLRQEVPELLVDMAESAMMSHLEPDNGIWELRNGPMHLVHSKGMCWVALDRALQVAHRLGIEANFDRWRSVRDQIRAEYEARGWDATLGAYVQAYDRPVLDASLLRLCLFGALDPKSDRFTSTLREIERGLGRGDLLYRYLAPDGLNSPEGTFAACAFWRGEALAMRGETRRSEAVFREILGYGNDLGLFSEEIDPRDGKLLGNFPQGFTHMAIVNGAARLNEAVRQHGWR